MTRRPERRGPRRVSAVAPGLVPAAARRCWPWRLLVAAVAFGEYARACVDAIGAQVPWLPALVATLRRVRDGAVAVGAGATSCCASA